MSFYNDYYYNDYVTASNNSINDNKLNAKKAARNSTNTIHQLKKIIKPLLAVLKKHKSNSNTYKKQPQPEFYNDDYSSEIDDNFANEILENQIFEEIDLCNDNCGVPVYGSNGQLEVVPVQRGQRYVPVHFARTEAGTFFWTSMVGPDSDLNGHGDENAISNYQKAELQAPSDRWAQA